MQQQVQFDSADRQVGGHAVLAIVDVDARGIWVHAQECVVVDLFTW